MRSSRLAAFVVVALIACGDNSGALHDGSLGDDAPDDDAAQGNDAALGDAGIDRDASIDAPADAAIDAMPFCGDGHVDPGEQCDQLPKGLGGDGCSSTCTNEMFTWTNLTPNPLPPVIEHQVAYDSARQRLVLFGGRIGAATSNQTWEWDGTTWTQRLTLVSPLPRVRHAMVYDAARQRVVLFGGVNSGNFLGDTWEWNGTTWTQRIPPASPPATVFHRMAYDPVRQVTVLQDGATWEWNGSNWVDKTPTMGATPGFAYDLVYAGAAGVMLLSGTKNWFWNGTSWSEVTVNGQPVFGGRAVYDSMRDRVVLVGDNWNERDGLFVREWINGAWVRQPAQEAGGPIGSLFAAAFDTSRSIVLAVVPNMLETNTALWERDHSWREHHGSTPPPRGAPAITYDPVRARVFMFGGEGRGVGLSDSWHWDGSTWTVAQLIGAMPPQRAGAAITFDERRRKIVMFGGTTRTSYDADGNGVLTMIRDTWEWDGVWTQRFPTTIPGYGASGMTFDRRSGKVMLFDEFSDDTWLWDGVDWTRVVTQTKPSGSASLAYDGRRNVVVLYASDYVGSGYVGGVWEWNGVDWLSRGAAPPTGTIAYDPHLARIVLANRGELQSTFAIWDGTTWSTQSGPMTHSIGPMVFDRASRSWFVFGGPWGSGWETWLGRHAAADPRERCDGTDVDNDGLTRCSDPDCWWRCTPLCAPSDTLCDPTAPKCGDGTCSSIEDNALCAADCP